MTEEQRNVTLVAYLVATKKETDNDFHMILATTADGAGPYLTAEVSGLPRMGTAADKATLTAARQQYRVVMAGLVPGKNYKLVDPPLPITVTGSLFYDMDHLPGVVGTGSFKPDTSWEIHPVTSIAAAPSARRLRERGKRVVHKFGRTTGYRAGRVTGVDTDVSVQYETGTYTFEGQIIIVGLNGQPFSAAGDSGSLILDRDTQMAVALLFAGSTSHTIANHIDDVLQNLNVTLA